MTEETVAAAAMDYEALPEADSNTTEVDQNGEFYNEKTPEEVINEAIQEYSARMKAFANQSSQYAATVANDAHTRAKYVSSKAAPILRKSTKCVNEAAMDVSDKVKKADWETMKSSLPHNWDVTRSIRAIFFCAMLLGCATYLNVHSSINVGLASVREEAGLLAVQRLRSMPGNEGSSLPTCKSLMQDKNSPYHSGDFLTRRTLPVSWRPRADHSRELQHSVCELHRYTAEEARQCLAGKHINMIGDSLTRYQYSSLAYFIHNGKYPARFERNPFGPCLHKDENGVEACSPRDEPNICMEHDWLFDANLEPNFKDSWTTLMQTIGGDKYFGGHMESNAIRTHASPFETIVENYFYASPPNEAEGGKKVFLSYNSELGWLDEPTPIHGFTFTGCAFHGGCTYSDELIEERLSRAANMDFDFSQPLEEAIGPDGILRHILPPVDIALYNRGLWGPLQRERASRIFPQLYNFSKAENGRCYYRGTNPRFNEPLPEEPWFIRHEAHYNGCGYIDHAHLVADFTEMVFQHPRAPDAAYGNLQDERETIYWDAVHFRPWVYEELNNMLLNILCNNA